jgi:hypothetical protein
LSYLSHSATLDGNFISYRYFSVIENDIRQAFQLKDPLSDLSQIVLNDIKSKSNPVSLHIRRGDYASNPSTFKMHGILSENYYKKACHLVSKITDEEPHFFIFSDDLEFSEKSTDYISHKTIVKTNSESPYEDMYLMSMCQNHIIANSTFSWWGAWLNPREDKIVIAPRQWFSDHDLRRFNLADIFPPGWILM